MNGGPGHDLLDGVNGNDKLEGSGGNDTFVFSAGADVVVDFEALNGKEDVDRSADAAIPGFRGLKNNHMSETSGGVVIDDLSGNTMTLLDVLLSDLDKSDFIF